MLTIWDTMLSIVISINFFIFIKEKNLASFNVNHKKRHNVKIDLIDYRIYL